MREKAIAIDGPSAAGKSTVAKRVADALNFQYIDTGAMYRALTWKALQNGIDVDDRDAIDAMAKETKVRLIKGESGTKVLLDDVDVTKEIREPLVTHNVSAVSMSAGARLAMVEQQRQMAAEGGVVMDGRDIGSHVLPKAELKIFLTASSAARAQRRFFDWKEKGIEMPLDEIEADLARRDHLDSTREISPLKQAEDAVLLDTTEMDIHAVTERILQLWEGRTGNVL